MSAKVFQKIAAGLCDAAQMTAAFDVWWSKASRLGDPIRRPNLIEEAFAAGFLAGQQQVAAAVQAERARIKGILSGYDELNKQICCDGRECCCRGSTVLDEIEHYIDKAGDTSALAAAVEAARDEGRIEGATLSAAELAEAVEAARREGYKAGWNDREGDLLTGIDRVYGAAEEEAAIRARSGGKEGA